MGDFMQNHACFYVFYTKSFEIREKAPLHIGSGA